ncbi:MAG: hypothetical protein ACU0CC_13910 [Sagittula sp.]|uniref:hypothetical protein n=1 Tax=Sagittula sp. TaxID=2038081 RepID=UPI0040588E10
MTGSLEFLPGAVTSLVALGLAGPSQAALADDWQAAAQGCLSAVHDAEGFAEGGDTRGAVLITRGTRALGGRLAARSCEVTVRRHATTGEVAEITGRFADLLPVLQEAGYVIAPQRRIRPEPGVLMTELSLDGNARGCGMRVSFMAAAGTGTVLFAVDETGDAPCGNGGN